MIQNFNFQLDIIRSNRRKTISIQILHAKIKVLAPIYVTDKKIQSIVQKHTSWIQKKLKDQLLHTYVSKARKYVDGDVFLYLGKNYVLRILSYTSMIDRFRGIEFNQSHIELHVPPVPDQQIWIKQFFSKWYKKQAMIVLTSKTELYSKKIGVRAKRLVIKSYKARWGACSTKGDIFYNWKIIMAPEHVVDYVVVHELCHLLESNHSPNFWGHVGHILPHYKDEKNWLKQNERFLVLD